MKEDRGSARTSLCGFIEANKPGKSGLNPLKSALSYQTDPVCSRGLSGPLFCHQHKFVTWDVNRNWVCGGINYLFKRVRAS